MSTTTLETFRKRVQEIRKTFPKGHTAILPSLLAAQEAFGYVTEESLQVIQEELGIPKGILVQTGSYYHFIDFEDKGKYRMYLCTNLTCLLHGAQKLVDFLENHLGVGEGEVTSDGLFSFEQVECIGLCDSPPAGILAGEQVPNLTPEKLASWIQDKRNDR